MLDFVDCTEPSQFHQVEGPSAHPRSDVPAPAVKLDLKALVQKPLYQAVDLVAPLEGVEMDRAAGPQDGA